MRNRKYAVKLTKEELKESFKSDEKFGKYITTLCNKAIEDIYGIKNYYSSEEWKGVDKYD